MYSSGIELPKVQFSLIDYAYIETGSYFTGFDLDNSGKLSKMDNSGTITVIEGAGESSAHYIGEVFGGGVIFYLWKDSNGIEHGLIASINEFNAEYSNITTTLGNTSRWDGQTNTNLMAAQSGATSGAWKICMDYSYDGYTDWYLPAIDELKLISYNEFILEQVLANIPGSDILGSGEKWSSTALINDIAQAFNFSDGTIVYFSDKTNSYNVRPIRKF